MENNPLFYLFPIITRSSRPSQNGILWETNLDNQDAESSDSKKYENPIDVDKLNMTKYQTPEKRRTKVDDTLTMHTADLMSVLKSSVIKPLNDTEITEAAPSHNLRRDDL